MAKQRRAVRLIVGLVVAGWIGAGAARAQTTVTSTEQDQKELAVTVYNSNVALVRDVRRIKLPEGSIDLRYMDIAAQVNPATVHIVSLTAPKELNVLEQDYEYDLLSPQKLLQKYVGKELTLVRVVTENNSTREVPMKAVLLADNDGPVWKVGNEIITGMGADRYVFPDLPENLYSKPTLVWLLDNRRAGEQTVEASYLTNQMNWNADYVLTVHSDQKSADLNGWVTVVNQSGASFRNALLQLVAGELNRVTPNRGRMEYAMATKAMPRAAAIRTRSHFRVPPLHLAAAHDHPRKRNQADQPAGRRRSARLRRSLRLTASRITTRTPRAPGQPVKEPVKVYIKFKNSAGELAGSSTAGGHRARLPGGLQRPRAIHR